MAAVAPPLHLRESMNPKLNVSGSASLLKKRSRSWSTIDRDRERVGGEEAEEEGGNKINALPLDLIELEWIVGSVEASSFPREAPLQVG